MKDVSNYVEQEDALLGVLTVRETLSFAARLGRGKLPENRAIRESVDHMLHELGLADVASNRIGTALQRGISGGQKRRVTLGVSAIVSPFVGPTPPCRPPAEIRA
jgi:ABC-type multidrug transport system ATPase subunit